MAWLHLLRLNGFTGSARLLWMIWLARDFPSEREIDTGTFADHFVYVSDDGTARELTPDEKAYLNTKFLPSDGARPYFKYRYGQKTPTGSLRGFLLRRKLPRRILVSQSKSKLSFDNNINP